MYLFIFLCVIIFLIFRKTLNPLRLFFFLQLDPTKLFPICFPEYIFKFKSKLQAEPDTISDGHEFYQKRKRSTTAKFDGFLLQVASFMYMPACRVAFSMPPGNGAGGIYIQDQVFITLVLILVLPSPRCAHSQGKDYCPGLAWRVFSPRQLG